MAGDTGCGQGGWALGTHGHFEELGKAPVGALVVKAVERDCGSTGRAARSAEVRDWRGGAVQDYGEGHGFPAPHAPFCHRRRPS